MLPDEILGSTSVRFRDRGRGTPGASVEMQCELTFKRGPHPVRGVDTQAKGAFAGLVRLCLHFVPTSSIVPTRCSIHRSQLQELHDAATLLLELFEARQDVTDAAETLVTVCREGLSALRLAVEVSAELRVRVAPSLPPPSPPPPPPHTALCRCSNIRVMRRAHLADGAVPS